MTSSRLKLQIGESMSIKTYMLVLGLCAYSPSIVAQQSDSVSAVLDVKYAAAVQVLESQDLSLGTVYVPEDPNVRCEYQISPLWNPASLPAPLGDGMNYVIEEYTMGVVSDRATLNSDQFTAGGCRADGAPSAAGFRLSCTADQSLSYRFAMGGEPILNFRLFSAHLVGAPESVSTRQYSGQAPVTIDCPIGDQLQVLIGGELLVNHETETGSNIQIGSITLSTQYE